MGRLAGTEMDSFGDNEITRLLRLKRYEQPPPDYFENFLHEFHRRQRERDELFRQPLWRICFERAEPFVLRLNIRSFASAGIALVIACARRSFTQAVSATGRY